ncbi:MAG: hypothetical protein AAB795_02775 [Patescibacteria group bacterium]|mgnify:FL=1
MNNNTSLLIIPSIILLGLISLLPAKTIEQKNITGVVASLEINQLPIPDIQARAALVVDFENSNILFEKNSKEALPLASLTKIISALVIEDNSQPDDFVRISKQAVETDGASRLKIGEYFAVKDLLAMAMIESSNDSISALVEFVATKQNIVPKYSEIWFTNLMRQKALSLGAENMIFNNPTGLDVSTTTAGGYGSVENIIQIAQKSYSSNIWRFSSAQRIISQEGRIHTLYTTNILEGDITQLVGSKTGFTDVAGGNLLVLFEYPINHPKAIVVLGSTSQGRFDDVKTLFDYVKKYSTINHAIE